TANGSTFPTTAGAIQKLRFAGHEDVFVLKLNAAGSGLVYSTLLGGTFAEVPTTLAIDIAGNAYVGGYTGSVPVNSGYVGSNFVPFPTTPGALNQPLGAAGAFVSKLNPTGTALLYSAVFGGTHESSISGITIDSGGSAYFA